MSLEMVSLSIILPILLWIGPFPIVPILVITFLIGDCYRSNPIKRIFVGCSLGYFIGAILRFLGVAIVILVDSVGIAFVVTGVCVEVISLSWYLYNDAKNVIEENKLRATHNKGV
ncbi:hypothetical protein M0R72_15115 [Candidatus Pacearchaeota archaeon]|jgi:hypothetical protein|nr:hypothetical protein [Candidatus Pacearchaeota archaeon]